MVIYYRGLNSLQVPHENRSLACHVDSRRSRNKWNAVLKLGGVLLHTVELEGKETSTVVIL